MEIYGRVRRAVRVEGQSQRAVAKEFGLSRETVRKMLQYAVPPGYQRQQPINRPKLGPWLGVIDAIVEDDKQRPVKQRHTAKRIFERLKEEHGFTGGYTIVKDYVRGEQLHTREMFVPLTHAPGEAQVDFGEALVVIAGVEQKAHYLAMDLPHSDDCFVVAFPAETTEAFLEGHVRAFAYFGGVPTRILYDNTKIAVAKILGGEERKRTRSFSELQSYYLFADKFGRPAKGNDKGKVEGLVGYARRNFMVPIPRVSSWEELNARLEAESQKRRPRRLRGHTETIGERFERDHRAMLPLPAAPYEACEKIAGRAAANKPHLPNAESCPRTRLGVEGPLPLRSRGPSTPQSHNNYSTIHWPTFTPPQWPSFTPPLTSDPVELLGSSRKNTLSAEIYFVSSASKGMYPPPRGIARSKESLP